MDLNKLLAFNQLVIDKAEDEKKRLALSFDIDYEEYTKRILGKEKEADFIIIPICRLSPSATWSFCYQPSLPPRQSCANHQSKF